MNLVCRTCLETATDFTHLFNHFVNGRALSDMLIDCASIDVEMGDGLPYRICEDCLTGLISAWNFRSMVITSNAKLRGNYDREENELESWNSLTCDTVIKEETCVSNCETMIPNESQSSGDEKIETNEETQILSSFPLVSDNIVGTLPSSSIDQNNLISNDKCSQIICYLNNDGYRGNDCRENMDPLTTNPGIFESDVEEKNILLEKQCCRNDTGFEQTQNCEKDSPEILTDELLEHTCDKHQINSNSLTSSNSELQENHSTKPGKIDRSKGPRGIFCKQCNKTISYRNYYKVHAPSHNINGFFKCDICEKYFVSNYFLSLHKSVHNRELPHVCDFCGKSFQTYPILRFHRRQHLKARLHVCKLCSAGFKHKASLEAHFATHNKERKYVCDTCGKSFKTRNNLSEHKSSHVTEKTLPCASCDKLFSSKKKLKVHLRCHSDNRPYKCEYCSKAYKTIGEKKRHALSHTGEKPYSCKLCNKTFSDCSSVGRHMLIHTGETPYSCDKCSLKFRYKQRFDSHMKNHK